METKVKKNINSVKSDIENAVGNKRTGKAVNAKAETGKAKAEEANTIYFTITGTKYYYGKDFFEKDQIVRLEKEPDNEYDKESIKVMLDGLGDVGHVANSPYTVIGDSWSAGRIYDKIGDTAEGTVMYVTPNGILCRINQ